MRKRSPHVVGRTVLGAPFAGRPTAPVARGNLSSRPPLRCVSAALDRLRTFGVTACNRVFHGAHGNVRRPTYAISRAQPAHLWREAPDRRRPSSGARGVGVAAPYGGCETCVDACMVTGIRRYPFTHAGRAWKPAPTVGIRTAPTLVPTPQSRRKAPRQLPFQGSRGVGGGLRRLRICLPRCEYPRFAAARKGRRPRRPAVAGLPRWVGCGRSA